MSDCICPECPVAGQPSHPTCTHSSRPRLLWLPIRDPNRLDRARQRHSPQRPERNLQISNFYAHVEQLPGGGFRRFQGGFPGRPGWFEVGQGVRVGGGVLLCGRWERGIGPWVVSEVGMEGTDISGQAGVEAA